MSEDGDDGDWDLLEDLARSSDPNHQRAGVTGAGTKVEELLRTLGYLARSTPAPGSGMPKTLSESMRLVVAAIPLNDLDTKLRFAREVRNRLSHEPQKLEHIDLLQAFLSFRQFATEVSSWVKSARYPSVSELRRRAGSRMGRSSLSPMAFDSDEEPNPASIDPSAFATLGVGQSTTTVELEPTPKEDLRSIGAAIRELWNSASDATAVLSGRLRASESVHQSKRLLVKGVYLVLGAYAVLTTAALTIGTVSSHGGAELVARGLALLAFVCISVFGNVIVFATTFASETVRGALEPGRRILLSIMASVARTQAIQELTRAGGAGAPERFAQRVAEVIPKYLVGTVTLPLSIWAVWVFCFPYWSLAIWGIAIVSIVVIVYGAGARGSGSWDESSKRARVYVGTAAVAGVLLAVLALKFEPFANEVRSVAGLASGFTNDHLSRVGTLLDFGHGSLWRSAPGLQFERMAVLGTFLLPFGLVLTGAYVALSRSAGLGGGYLAVAGAKLSAIAVGLAWAGVLGARAIATDEAAATVLELDNRSEKTMESESTPKEVVARSERSRLVDTQAGPRTDDSLPTTAPWKRDVSLWGDRPSPGAEWQQSLFSTTCPAPCAGGSACESNPKACVSRVTCIPGEGTELLGVDETERWVLHLSAVGLLNPDGSKSDPCQTGRDYWICRAGTTTGCLSQQEACLNVKDAAASPNGIVISRDDLVHMRTALDVWEGTPGAEGVKRATTMPIPKFLRRGLCQGGFVNVASGDPGRVSFFLWSS